MSGQLFGRENTEGNVAHEINITLLSCSAHILENDVSNRLLYIYIFIYFFTLNWKFFKIFLLLEESGQALGAKSYPPPYLARNSTEADAILRGMNYASGAAGILDETGFLFVSTIHYYVLFNSY